MLTHEFKFSDADFKQLETLLTKYVTALKDNINSRFEDALSVLKAFDIFNPVSLPERTAAEFIDYGVTSLEKLIESFFPVTEPDKKNEIVTEWNKIKYNMLEWKKRIQTHNNSSDLSKTQLMLKMMLMRKTDLNKFFPHIIELAEICQSMPVSNAWPERGASTIKRIKTRLRSTLRQDMIMTLMNVSINGPKTENSQQVTEKAVKHWRNEKDSFQSRNPTIRHMKMKKHMTMMVKRQRKRNATVIRQSTAMKVDLTPRASPAQTQILGLLHQAWRMNPHPQQQYLLMIILIQKPSQKKMERYLKKKMLTLHKMMKILVLSQRHCTKHVLFSSEILLLQSPNRR